MVEDQDPVEGGVGVNRRWDSATEGLEGGGLPGPFSSPLTLRENILDEGGPRFLFLFSPALQTRL